MNACRIAQDVVDEWQSKPLYRSEKHSRNTLKRLIQKVALKAYQQGRKDSICEVKKIIETA